MGRGVAQDATEGRLAAWATKRWPSPPVPPECASGKHERRGSSDWAIQEAPEGHYSVGSDITATLSLTRESPNRS